MAKLYKVSKSYKKDEGECEHSWHLAHFWTSPFDSIGYQAKFICDKCGKLKTLPKINSNLKEQI